MWKQLSPEEGAGWDGLLERADDDNPFQSDAWARYKRRSGWEPQRWTASAGGGAVICSLQLLKKTLPLGRTVIWVPGGPMVGFPGADPGGLEPLLREGIRRIAQANRAVYARFYSLKPSAPETRRALSGLCAKARGGASSSAGRSRSGWCGIRGRLVITGRGKPW